MRFCCHNFFDGEHADILTLARFPIVLQAIKCLLGSIEINPNDSSAYSKLGLNYGKSGKLDSAMQAFDTALALDPNNNMARSNKAVALERMGKQEVCRHLSL